MVVKCCKDSEERPSPVARTYSYVSGDQKISDTAAGLTPGPDISGSTKEQ